MTLTTEDYIRRALTISSRLLSWLVPLPALHTGAAILRSVFTRYYGANIFLLCRRTRYEPVIGLLRDSALQCVRLCHGERESVSVCSVCVWRPIYDNIPSFASQIPSQPPWHGGIKPEHTRISSLSSESSSRATLAGNIDEIQGRR